MTRRKFDPPLKKKFVALTCGYDVYTVDAFAIRNAAQPEEEFDNVAIYDDFPDLIEKATIWTAQSTWRREGRFFVANAVARLDALEKGKSESDSFDVGLIAEQRLREATTGIKYRDGKPHRRVPKQVYVRPYCEVQDEKSRSHAWIVDGCFVRCSYKTDYTEGGHGHVYPWCPRDQIWLERSIDRAELPYILAHEYIESRLMRDEGLEYDRAHEICAEMEFDLRKAKERAKFPGLNRRRLTKHEVSAFAAPEFFEYVKANYVRGIFRRLRALVSDAASQMGLS